MTGHDHDHDENAPENLGPNEGLDPFFEQGPQPKRKLKPSDAEDSPEDMLFETGAEDGAGESIANPGAPFQEDGRAPWAGRGLTPDEIGIPVEGEGSHLDGDDDLGIDSEQELELVDEVEVHGDDGELAEAEALDRGADDIDESDESEVDSLESAEDESQGDSEYAIVEDEVVADDDLVLEDTDALAEAAEHVESADDDPLAGEVFVLDDGEAANEEEPGTMLADEPLPTDNYPVEDGWEPVQGTAEDPQDSDSFVAEAGEADEVADEVVDAADATGSAGDEFLRRRQFAVVADEQDGEAPELVAAAPLERRSWFGRAAASVAAAAVLAAAGVAVLQPQWLGLSLEPELVERVTVARPETAPKIKPPVVPTEPKPVTDTNPQPEPKAEPKSSDPKPSEGNPPVQVPTEPVQTGQQPPQPQGESQGAPQIDPPELPRYLPAGESMWIGQFDSGERETLDWANVRPGSKAFAQLQNGNFFIGSVKGVAADALVLMVKQGEVTLPRAEVTKITGLDTRDYSELQRATAGFLKLSNKNRLVGQILESVDDDHFVLQMRSDRIVVPRATVEKVVQQPGSENLRFGSTGDEEGWLREMAERQLQSERTGRVIPAVPPAKKLRDEPVRQVPVQKTGPKAPVDRR